VYSLVLGPSDVGFSLARELPLILTPALARSIHVLYQLLATAAAAAASQVAEAMGNDGHHPPVDDDDAGVPLPPPLEEMYDSSKEEGREDMHGPDGSMEEDPDLLEARRQKDRRRYSAMTPEARAAYNQHRRELYHRQGEAARKRRRERERERYHSLEGESKKQRNERRAKLERDRYNKLQKDALAERNAKRRERARARKSLGKAGGGVAEAVALPPPGEEGDVEDDADVGVPHLPDPESTTLEVDAAMADAALAAEVAERVIAGTDLDVAAAAAAVGVVAADSVVMEGEGSTIQI
jgi:hypothetical protein